MSLNSINKFLTKDSVWITLSIVLIAWYLSPLFGEHLYVPIFDNLDSNVVWNKILAHSGMIFADNNAIIPNMMSGLPRSSWGSEFKILLWLYYFFDAKTAFVINEVAIHLIAFFSMFVFLKRYVVKPNSYYGSVPIYAGSIYFALIPYWSGAGASIALLPIVTYSLLNIKNKVSTKFDWVLLIILPMYADLIFLYMFYIVYAGVYMLYDMLKNRKLNLPLFSALLLMSAAFLLSEYRVVYSIFLDSGFVSHRTEFDIFFNQSLWDCYKMMVIGLVWGHIPHAMTLQEAYLLPIVLFAMLLTYFSKRLNILESMFIWLIFILTFIADIWNKVFINRYTIPLLLILSIWIYFKREKYRQISLMMILTISILFISVVSSYDGLAWITNILPILRELNILRFMFVLPFVFVVMLVFALLIIYRKLRFGSIFVFVFILFQSAYGYEHSFYQVKPKKDYASFEQYYAPNIFDKLKKDLGEKVKISRFVGYGLEPAVMLYNGLHTVDGYSTNYPLEYKYKFKKIFSKYNYADAKTFDGWASKLYIMTVHTKFKYYIKNLSLKTVRFSTDALCELGTDYIISPYMFPKNAKKGVKLLHTYIGKSDSWDIYLYSLDCHR